MSVFPRLFLFYRVFGWFQRWEFKSTTKNVLQNKSCRKVFTKNSTKNPKPIFLRFFLIKFLVFGRFSMSDEWSSKTRQKNIEKINLTLVLVFFRTLTHPPTTGVTDFFFGRPSALAKGLGHTSHVTATATSFSWLCFFLARDRARLEVQAVHLNLSLELEPILDLEPRMSWQLRSTPGSWLLDSGLGL
jgi:hypothetical protein